MKFGMSMYPFSRYPTAEAIFETARLADELGFETITIGEHVVVPKSHVGIVPDKWYDSLTLGAAIAAATTKIRIFFSVLVVPYYHPIRLAKALATLDIISGGRLIVGVGAGWLKNEFDLLGVPFEERGARLDESLAAMKELWTSDDPRFHGRWTSFQDLVFDPRPVQRPHPPIWVGGWGKNAIRRAVTLGDGLYPATSGPLSRIIARKEETTRLLEIAGRDPTRSKYENEATPIRDREHLAFAPDEPGLILEHVEIARAAGISNISVRFPGSDHRQVAEAMRKFHAEIMTGH
jgi:probable F420-dependent oxidoreductase